jgi:hypothetical protein
MILSEKRIELLDRLGKYMLSEDEEWVEVQLQAARSNPWFTAPDIHTAVKNIALNYLQKKKGII